MEERLVSLVVAAVLFAIWWIQGTPPPSSDDTSSARAPRSAGARASPVRDASS